MSSRAWAYSGWFLSGVYAYQALSAIGRGAWGWFIFCTVMSFACWWAAEVNWEDE